MHDGRAIYEKMGIRFGELVKDDPIFIEATLPQGWKKVGTDHAMWSKLLDEKGRGRAMIFYKAAFYDRSAHMSAKPRFSVSTYDENRKRGAPRIGTVSDADGSVRFTSEPFAESAKGPWEADDAARAACVAWLDANYPDYKNPLAYWDVP